MPDKKPQWAFRYTGSDNEYIIAWDKPVYISHDRDMDVVFRTPDQYVTMLKLSDDSEASVVANSLYDGSGSDEGLLYVPLNQLTDNEFSPQYYDYYLPRGALLSLRKLPEGWKPDSDDIH